MYKSEINKSLKLGMKFGTAYGHLKKAVLFEMAKRCEMDKCFQCGKIIENVNDFTIDHKKPYLNAEDPIEAFFNLDNIAFSHAECNTNARKAIQPIKHGTKHAYLKRGCRCDKCINNWKDYRRKYMANKRAA